MLLVNVSLETGVPAPTTVQFKVLQGASPLAQKDLAWPGGATVNVGLELPKGSVGAVTVMANGITSGSLVSRGSADGTIGGQPIVLVLKVVPTSGLDAGTSSPEAGATAVDGQPGDPVGHPDVVQAADLVVLDQALAEVGTPVEVGTHDVPPADAGVPDAPSIDAATDAPTTPDSAPADTTTDGAVGGDGATRSWSQPLNVQKSAGAYVVAPSVAVHPASGDAVVVWADNGLGVMAVRYLAATDTWSAQVALSTEVNLRLAQVVVDAKGHYMAVWTKDGDGADAGDPGIWGSFSADGATWSKPTQFFSGGTNNWDIDIRVAMNRSGQAEVVWDHFRSPDDGTMKHQLYGTYVEGTANQPAQMVATCGSECTPRVTIDGSGNGIVVWSQPDPIAQQDSVWGATFAKQAFGTPHLLENFDTDWARNAEVAMNSAGQGMVIWQQPVSSTALDLYTRRYSVTAGWDATPELVTRVYWSGVMSLALDSYGTAALGWSKPTAMLYQAMFSSETYGSSWTTESLETDDQAPDLTSTDIEPQIAIDGSGHTLFGWRKKISDTEFAPHFRWRSGNTWGSETERGVIPDMFSSDMRLGVTDDGRAVAAWTYYHCDPSSSGGDTACPTGKPWSGLSAASKAAWGNIFVAVYR
jgi:hypothetical protein